MSGGVCYVLKELLRSRDQHCEDISIHGTEFHAGQMMKGSPAASEGLRLLHDTQRHIVCRRAFRAVNFMVTHFTSNRITVDMIFCV